MNLRPTCGDQATCGPLFSPLLDHLQQILSIMIITDQMGAVDNHDQRTRAFASSGQGNFFQLVEGPFNVQQSSGISRTTDAEKTADVAVQSRQNSDSPKIEDEIDSLFVEFIVQGLAQTNPKDLKVGMRFEHGTTVAIDFPHSFEQHRGLSGALLADH